MAKTEGEKLDRRELLAAQSWARTTAANARDTTKARKQDTRRKVILGSLLVDAAEKDPHWRDTLDLLMTRVIREQDRKAFEGWALTVDDGRTQTPGSDHTLKQRPAAPVPDASSRDPQMTPYHAPFRWDQDPAA